MQVGDDAGRVPEAAKEAQLVPVTLDNFVRAETDTYFQKVVEDVGLGRSGHLRELTPMEEQDVVRMNRDTLYSYAVCDLAASPATVTIPESRGRFLSVQLIDQGHHVPWVNYAGQHTLEQERIGTRYVFLLVRIFVDPESPGDLERAHALQDMLRIDQVDTGRFDIPRWDPSSLARVRDAVKRLGEELRDLGRAFGRREDVDPVQHVVGTAAGWGGNPRRDALYVARIPPNNDGLTTWTLPEPGPMTS